MSVQKFAKWSDKSFKQISLVALGLSILTTAFHIHLTGTQEEKERQLMQQNKIHVIDPSGQSFTVSALDSQHKTFSIFGKLLTKKIFSFDYTGFGENRRFVEQFTSKEVIEEIDSLFSPLYQEVKTISGAYEVEIKDFTYIIRDGVFEMNLFIDHALMSRSKTENIPYMVKLELVNTSPNQENKAGVYLKSFKIIKSQEDIREKRAEFNRK